MNVILCEIEEQIQKTEEILKNMSATNPERREIVAFRDGLMVARNIAAKHMESWFSRKLTTRNTRIIRSRAAQGEKQSDLAREYNVSPSMISKIVNQKRRA